jgi:hypothetical protein
VSSSYLLNWSNSSRMAVKSSPIVAMISDPVNDSMTTDFSPRSRRSVPLAVGSNRHHDADRQARPFTLIGALADDAERVIMRSVVAGVLSQLGSDGGALRIIPGHGGG